ncbi:MAG: SRPBCC domain-containing protein [Myxococcota bacterium]
MTMLQDTKTLIDKANHTFTFKRVFPAKREEIFDAWTKPEHVRCWWDPSGTPLAECVIDLRPGGAFRFTNQGDAHSPPFAGVYQVVERPSMLVFEAMGALGTVKLEEKAGTTTMMVTIRCGSSEHFEMFMKLGVHEGTDRTFDNLVAYQQRRSTRA